MNIALRERNLDTIGIQGVVHDFRGSVGIGDAFGSQDLLLHYDIHSAVAE